MSDKKSLGQIAHEAGERICGWARRWDGMSESQRQEWEQIAEAVVAAVQSVDVAEEPGFGRRLMQNAGIIDASGKLTPLYGGEE